MENYPELVAHRFGSRDAEEGFVLWLSTNASSQQNLAKLGSGRACHIDEASTGE